MTALAAKPLATLPAEQYEILRRFAAGKPLDTIAAETELEEARIVHTIQAVANMSKPRAAELVRQHETWVRNAALRTPPTEIAPTADLTRVVHGRADSTRWILTGPAGSVTLDSYGMTSGIEYHWRTPLFDGDTPGACPLVDYPCYSDGSSYNGRQLVAEWRRADLDDAVVWAELERWYKRQAERDAAPADADATADQSQQGDEDQADEPAAVFALCDPHSVLGCETCYPA